MRLRKAILLGVIFLIPLLPWINELGKFAYPLNSTYSDVTISHYPNAVSLWQGLVSGQIPWWSNQILGGYPFYADPLSGLWYPPGWLAAVFPSALAFNLTIGFHLILLAFGMYFFLRAIGLTESASVTGALVIEMMPKLYAHWAAGHVTLLYAFCLTPWLLYWEYRRNRSGDRWAIAGVGITIGLISLADIRWTAYSGLLWALYAIYCRLSATTTVDRQNWQKWGVGALSGIAIGLMISAPLLGPLIQFTQLSTRSTLTTQDNLAFSMPPGRLLGMLVPDIGANAEWVLYPGAFAVLTLIAALAIPSLRKKSVFWIGSVFLGILLALGQLIPGMDILGSLPLWSLLRVPSRFLFWTVLGLAIIAAYVVDGFQRGELRYHWNPMIYYVALSSFVTLIAVGIGRIQTSIPIEFVYATVVLWVSSFILLALERKWLNRWMAGLLIVIAVCLPALLLNQSSIVFRTPSDVLSEGSFAAQYLSKQTGYFRVYSPSYSIPQQTAASAHIQLADGINPLQLTTYVRYMEKATGIPNLGYSVTLPPFLNADPLLDNEGYQPDMGLLGRLNVEFLVAEYEIPDPQLILLARSGETRVYRNSEVLPRVWVQADIKAEKPTAGTITVQQSVNHTQVEASGPGVLVLSEINYPGWTAFVDGIPAAIQSVDGLFMAVDLPAGNHKVEFEFFPKELTIYLALAGLGWGLAFGIGFWRRRWSKKTTTTG